MSAYYNEFEPFPAQWMRNLITRGLIAPGEVDERSIEDVHPDDVRGFTQCHFFAGIGLWSYALRQAGWGDGQNVWTGSCPCQPFSEAGKGEGVADERHLWPAFFHLISECRPDTVFGEQVEGAIKHSWLDLVQADLEGVGYTTGSICAPAAGVGAPHIRSRVYWTGCRNDNLCEFCGYRFNVNTLGAYGCPNCCGDGMGDPDNEGLEGYAWNGRHSRESSSTGSIASPSVSMVGVGHTNEHGRDSRSEAPETSRLRDTTNTAGWTNGFWKDVDWLPFRDAKLRPVEPGTFPVVNGGPPRVGDLRAYGNAIVPPLATEFIKAVMQCRPG